MSSEKSNDDCHNYLPKKSKRPAIVVKENKVNKYNEVTSLCIYSGEM